MTQSLLDLEKEHKMLQPEGDGYLNIIREAWDADQKDNETQTPDNYWDDMPPGNFQKGDVVAIDNSDNIYGVVVDHSPIQPEMVIVRELDGETLTRINETRLRKVGKTIPEKTDDAPTMPE